MPRADETFERLAYIIPAATRDGGAELATLAEKLEVPREQILDDLATAADRDFYHPGGWVSDVVVMTSADRIEVDRAGAFERPGKLNAREALCLAIGLRGLGAESFASVSARQALVDRADRLAADGARGRAQAASLEIADDRVDGSGIEEAILRCTRERQVCRIEYLTRDPREGRRIAVEREIEPHVMARSEGYWYALSWCRLRGAVRAFRLDRVIEAAETDESFDVRPDFDAEAWIEERRVYHGRDETPTRIRYAPEVARWVREDAHNRGLPCEELDDGAVVVEHRVADWDWAVRHALSYGAAAEIVEPAEVRERVRAVLGGWPGRGRGRSQASSSSVQAA